MINLLIIHLSFFSFIVIRLSRDKSLATSLNLHNPARIGGSSENGLVVGIVFRKTDVIELD